MRVIGIDPGLDGGVALIEDGAVTLNITPTIAASKGSTKRSFDRRAMIALLKRGTVDLAIIELVSAAPIHGRVQGSTSMFNFGVGYGTWLGLLSALDVPYQEVRPQAWKGNVLAGTARDKQAAIEFCQRRFPNTSLLASSRCKKPHDGLADALCLAEYGRRLLGGK